MNTKWSPSTLILLLMVLSIAVLGASYWPWLSYKITESPERIRSWYPNLGSAWLLVRRFVRPMTSTIIILSVLYLVLSVRIKLISYWKDCHQAIIFFLSNVRFVLKRIGSLISRYRVITITLLTLILGEFALRHFLGVYPNNPPTSISPPNFFQPDDLLGWKNGAGHYSVSLYEGGYLFDFNTNKAGNRYSCPHDTSVTDKRPTKHLYGCSFIFGYAVADTACVGYKLQGMLPAYRVINKGVPGYGLAQMFLSLQKSVAAGDTPRLVVFNYSRSHDARTPLCKQMSGGIWSAIMDGNPNRFENFEYPYYDLVNDSLTYFSKPLSKLTHNWPGTNKSSLMMLFNQLYMHYHDEKQFPYYHQIALRTSVDIMRYCKDHSITAAFATLANTRNVDTPTDIRDTLIANGYNTLDYGIDIKEEKYNCSPKDPSHPSGLAHSVYAQSIYRFMHQK